VETLEKHSVINWNKRSRVIADQALVGEEPLSIRIQGNPYSVIMRTPGDEIAHVAGFCLGEGIVDSPDDFATIAFCDDSDTNVVTVTLKPSHREKITEILDRRGYISQTSCGLCGKEIVEDLYQRVRPLENTGKIEIQKSARCLEMLADQQPLRKKTRASHAAVIYDSNYQVLSTAEDVGRHNALDKAIGRLFLNGNLDRATLLILSSRISYELVQKAARARIPVIFAMSRPTSLAVALATELNMTLASNEKGNGIYVFCGEHRLIL